VRADMMDRFHLVDDVADRGPQWARGGRPPSRRFGKAMAQKQYVRRYYGDNLRDRDWRLGGSQQPHRQMRKTAKPRRSSTGGSTFDLLADWLRSARSAVILSKRGSENLRNLAGMPDVDGTPLR